MLRAFHPNKCQMTNSDVCYWVRGGFKRQERKGGGVVLWKLCRETRNKQKNETMKESVKHRCRNRVKQMLGCCWKHAILLWEARGPVPDIQRWVSPSYWDNHVNTHTIKLWQPQESELDCNDENMRVYRTCVRLIKRVHQVYSFIHLPEFHHVAET